MSAFSTERLRKRAVSVYARRALLQPTFFAIAVLAVIIGGMMHHVVAALFALPLLAIFVAVCAPRVRWFTRAVDGAIDRIEREQAATVRSHFLHRMGEAHRRELHELEQAADRLREYYGPLVVETFDIDGLLAAYVRLAIAHRTAAVMLESKSEPNPKEILEVTAPAAEANLVSVSLARRREVLRNRVDMRRAACDHQRALAIELATIADLIRCANEACAAAQGKSLHEELRAMFASRAEDAAGLSALVVDRDETIDAEVLRLGR